jgi:regulator of sigma E protease
MSEKPAKKRNIRGLIIASAVVIGALGLGYATNHEQFVLDFLLALGLIFLAITILVSIHELGHFLTARMFGMRVEKFSIGFPPKVFSVKRGETEYQIGATPLGGYVKISGMIDESLDTDYVDKEPQPYEFRSKPVWQRLIVMLGGVVMNVILGVLIFSTAKYITGDTFLPIEAVNKYGVEVFSNTIGHELGFKTGDKLMSINGEKVPYFDDYFDLTPIQSEGYYEVDRGGKTVKIDIPSDAINYFADDDSIGTLLVLPDAPAIVTVDTSGAKEREIGAYAAGLRTGDQIVRLDSTPISLFSQLRTYVKAEDRDSILVSYLREGQESQTWITLKTTKEGKKQLGVGNNWQLFYQDDNITKEYNFLQALAPGSKAAFGIVSSQAQGLARLAEPEVKTGKLIQGPIEIAKFYVKIFKDGGWPKFLLLTGTLSMILALMNILPIPALDGGHVMFLLFEMVTGREPSTQVRIIAQQIGLLIVFALMAYLILNGVFKQF